MFQRTLLILSIMAALFVTACQPVAPAPEPAILHLLAMTRLPSEDVVAAFESNTALSSSFLRWATGEALNKLILSADACATSSSASTTPS